MTEVLTKLSKGVECIICKKTLFNPRILPCHHTCCLACLDEIVVFEKNGSGKLKCPSSECNAVANIKSTETISSTFGINHSLQHVLDILKEYKETYVTYIQFIYGVYHAIVLSLLKYRLTVISLI